MNIKQNRLARVLLCAVSAIVILTACSRSGSDLVPDNNLQSNIRSENAHRTFSQLTNEIFLQEVTSDSITLHYTIASPSALGISPITPTYGMIGETVRLASLSQTRAYLDRLQDISYEALPLSDQITYDILKWQFEMTLSSEEFSYYQEEISPTIGLQAQLPILLAEYEFRCRQDIDDYLLLLKQLPDYYNQLLAYEQEKASRGLFMASFTVDSVVSQCENFLCTVDRHYLTSSFDNRIDATPWLSDSQKASYKVQNRATLTESVYPAYKALKNGLTALKGSGQNTGGLCHLPKGKDYYAYLVRKSTGSDSTPAELIKRTQKQLQSDLQAMSVLLDKNPALLENLSDLSITITSPEAILLHLQNRIREDFPTPPNVDFTLKYVDSSMEEHLSPAFYLTPPLDRITQNVIYINKPSFRDDIQLFTTLAHEGYPGHLYQNIMTQSYGFDNVRSLLSFPGYAEGYATYAEHLSYDYMGLDADVSRLLSLSSSVTLAIYGSLDLGIHYEGWSLEEATAYLTRYGITDSAAITQIYQSVVDEPANYLKYYVGYMEFLNLRNEAKDLWGKEYTDKRFHQYILRIGDAPFSVLKKYLKH